MNYHYNYYRKNKKLLSKKFSEKYANDPEWRRQRLEYAKKYYQANKETIKERKRLWWLKKQADALFANKVISNGYQLPLEGLNETKNTQGYKLTTPKGETFLIDSKAQIIAKSQSGKAIFATA